MDWFSADSHLGHKATLNENHCNRPFESLHDMNKTIIDNINSAVKEKDTLYILGDFAYRCSLETIIYYRGLIKCKHLILISGNHDGRYKKKEGFRNLFDRIEDRIFYKGFDVEIALDHYAMLSWPRSHYGTYHLFGHSHGNLVHPNPRAMDIGVDSWDFKPLSILEIKRIFESRLNKVAIKRVNFISKLEAEQIIPSNSEAIISISDPKERVNLSNNWNYKLELKFHDIDRPVDNRIQFNKDHYKKLMDFLEKTENKVEHIIVHCHAGICRSAAIAKFIADIYKLQFNHQYQLYNKFVYSFCRKSLYVKGED